jgi:hypothetical protein
VKDLNPGGQSVDRPMDRGAPACFTCAPAKYRKPDMNQPRPALVIAALLGTLLAAANAHAEKKIYGLAPVAVSNTMNCAAEASLALGSYLVYQTKEPIEKALPVAPPTAAGKADPKNTERRLREIYAAKPTQPTAWGKQVFQNCLAMKAVPIDYARTGNCYLLTYYIATVVPLYKSQGLDNGQIVAEVVPGKPDPAFKDRVRKLVDQYAARDTSNARKNNVANTSSFLQCVAPGTPAVSNS